MQDNSVLSSKTTTKTFKTPDTNKYLTSLVEQIQSTAIKGSSSINNVVDYTYNNKGLLHSQKISKTNNTLVKEYEYDSFSNIIKQTISGSNIDTRKEEYKYDAKGLNLVQVINALNHITTSTYDAKNNIISRTDANNLKTVYEYDVLNRKTKETRPDGTIST